MMSPLIQSLLAGIGFDHPLEQTQLLETHISWVILTGPFAYKFKKPVDLGFVDFTTLERREFFCQEELRLNRRHSPDLYLDLIAIAGAPEQPRLHVVAGDIPAGTFEFAVRMKQFPQELLLTEVMKRGELTPAHLRELATHVAEFHRQIAVADESLPFGTPEQFWQALEECLQAVATAEDCRPMLEELRPWCETGYQSLRETLAERRREGRVRECHGDMHLRNLVLLDDEVQLFDGIEFNPSLRWNDLMSEVAFLLMDLADHQADSLGWAFLNRWLEQTGDYAGLSVLRLFLVYRALVRAKVACLRLRQCETPAERAKPAEELHAYLQLALDFTRPQPTGLVLMHGLSGSGKSWLAEKLAERLPAVRIRSDVERKRLLMGDISGSASAEVGQGLYSEAATEQTYQELFRLAKAVLSAGWSAILDATFLQRKHRAAAFELAERLGVPAMIVETTATDDTLRQRIRERTNDPSDASLDVLERQLRTREPLTESEREATLSVDTERPERPPQTQALLETLQNHFADGV